MKIHVVIITSGYYGLSGAFTNARELSCWLAMRDFQVTVLAPDVDSKKNKTALNFIHIRDLLLIPQFLFYLISLWKLHRRHKIDIVLVYDSIAFPFVYVLARKLHLPIIFSVQASIFAIGRDLDYSWITTQIYRFTNRFVARYADRLICISQEMSRCMLYAGAVEEKISVIPNPIDLSIFRPAPSKKRERTCLYVGALRPTKGVTYLIHAIPHVLKTFPDTKFLIVGDGPQRREIEHLVEEYKINDSIDLIGYIEHSELSAYYQQASLFVMPSLNEPQGIVALEAMACGVPIIASRLEGIREMIEDECDGLLVPPGDSNALSKAVINMLESDGLRHRLSQKAIKKAQRFSWENVIFDYTLLFEEVLKK